MARRPFFMISSTPSAISFLALHLTQYPSAIKKRVFPPGASPRQPVNGDTLWSVLWAASTGKLEPEMLEKREHMSFRWLVEEAHNNEDRFK